MKKLVTAACALVAGLALADGVQSTNVVGYVAISAEGDAFTPVSVMFTDVGQNTLALDNIVFDGIYRYSTLQIFGSDGDLQTTLMYNREGTWEDDDREGTWEDDDGNDATDWVFQPGDSFWIAPNRDDVMVYFPGEVKTEALVVTAPGDEFTPFGNGTPAAVSLSDITFDGIYRYSTLQIFGSDGDLQTTLMYNREGTWEDDDRVTRSGLPPTGMM